MRFMRSGSVPLTRAVDVAIDGLSSGPSFLRSGKSIRARFRAPEIDTLARARREFEVRSATQGTDDSVFGVVELRCAGRSGPGRRECSERVCENLDE